MDLTTLTQNNLLDDLVLIVHSLQHAAIPADRPLTGSYAHGPGESSPCTHSQTH